jgi:thiol-disulfide isomerase/thioredoxin
VTEDPVTEAGGSAPTEGRAPRSGGLVGLVWVFGAVVVALVAVAVVAVVVTRGSDPGGDAPGGVASPSGGTVVPSGDLEAGSVTVTGAVLPPLAKDVPDPALGLPAPAVVGQAFDGGTVAVAGTGTGKVLVFLAHWCPHCQAEVPRIQAWLDANGLPDGVEVVAVATSNDATKANHPPGAWLRREGWSVPTMVDDAGSTAARAFGISGFPFFVVVDPSGQVVDRVSGEISSEDFAALVAAAAGPAAVPDPAEPPVEEAG